MEHLYTISRMGNKRRGYSVPPYSAYRCILLIYVLNIQWYISRLNHKKISELGCIIGVFEKSNIGLFESKLVGLIRRFYFDFGCFEFGSSIFRTPQ